MPKKNMILENLLNNFNNLKESISYDLSKIVNEREKRKYRDDILQLSLVDVSLLTSYYMNSNEEAQKKFSSLLFDTYNEGKELQEFLLEFKNLYYLNKAGLVSTTQYGTAKRVVMEFVNKLKDIALTEKKIDEEKEKKLADQLFISKKLIKYFSSKPGSIEIKNVDEFIMMLDALNISDKLKNDALYLANQNNYKYYTGRITTSKKSKV